MVTRTALVWSIIVAFIVGGIIGYMMFGGAVSNDTSGANMTNASVDKRVALYTNMRKLWADHVFWTREYMIGAINGSANTDAAATRLMKNQEDIGNAVAAYYNADAGNRLTTLLKQHISIAVEIVAAAKAKDQTKLKDADTRWKINANDIATLLSGANPNWPKATLTDMLNTHLSTTSDELNAILDKQYTRSVTAFDAVFNHMAKISDTLSAGIIKQYPDKF